MSNIHFSSGISTAFYRNFAFFCTRCLIKVDKYDNLKKKWLKITDVCLPLMCVSRSTGAAVIDSPPQATSSSSASSSANDVSSMSTETTDPSSDPTVASETDSSLDSHTSLGALACCR